MAPIRQRELDHTWYLVYIRDLFALDCLINVAGIDDDLFKVRNMQYMHPFPAGKITPTPQNDPIISFHNVRTHH